ncbi:contact-dependent growth inhibition system immunity protein [Mycolicibacterium vaccae]|uniref:contact-dependent growth inhibition system immunity protein n=1 Tax=Mycolicibacterium vaccae TaxID=1810 RepID=UPI003D03E4A1
MTEFSVSRPLSHFFRAYFHEDWDLEAADWEGLVDGYVRDEQPNSDLLRQLAKEIDDLDEPRSDAEMKGFVMHTLGAKYCPLPEMSYEEWLRQVAVRLRQHATAVDGGCVASLVRRGPSALGASNASIG